jgi:hypothetical protein
MTDGVLLLGRKLGGGAAFLGHDEEGIIPEAVVARGRPGDASLDGVSGFQQDLSIGGQGQMADEAGGAFLLGHVGQGVQQFGVVGRVCGGAWRVRGDFAGGVAGTVNTRRPVQRIHLQPRVVRQAGQVRLLGVVQRLVPRVLGEGLPGFVRFLDGREVLKAKD